MLDEEMPSEEEPQEDSNESVEEETTEEVLEELEDENIEVDENQIAVKKLHERARLPERQNPGDAGLDFYCVESEDIRDRIVKCRTGVAVKIPEGYVGLLFARSSIKDRGLVLANGVGVIDSGYTGEIKFFFSPVRDAYNPYKRGERIGQMVITPMVSVSAKEVEELPETARGSEGFGSTGQ